MPSHGCRLLAVVGTDTGVGKTMICSAVASHLLSLGITVAPFKPVESGCLSSPSGLVPSDSLMLIRFCDCRAPLGLVNPYRFSLPLSPCAASFFSGATLSRDHIKSCLCSLRQDHQAVIIEGAGGLSVPFGDDWLFSDLLVELSPSVLLVGRSSLGTINHCLLTLSELRRLGLRVLGFVLNRLTSLSGPDESTNPKAIERFGAAPFLGFFPYLESLPGPSDLARIACSNLDLHRLLSDWLLADTEA